MDLEEDFKQETLSILKNIVQIPSENQPGITIEIVDYNISILYKVLGLREN